MERKYISANGVVERTRYAVGDNARPRRGKRRGNTTFRKQEQNFNSALRRLARILNCNYCHENGLLITLDYDETGLERIIGSLQEEDRETIREMRAPVGKIGTWRVKGKVPARDCHDQCAHWSRNDMEGSACEVEVTAQARQGCRALRGSVEGVGGGTSRTPSPTGFYGSACTRDVEDAVPYGEDGSACDGEVPTAARRVVAPYDGDGKQEEDGDAEAVNRLREAADKQLTLWMRRVKRKFGGKIKAVLITSDVDHETGELVRVHHHVVLAAEGISWDLLRGEWKHGSVDIKQLRAQPDYTPIATYLMRQVRKQPDKKKYRVTQGMEQPKIEEREILCNSEMRAPAGANVLERSEYTAESIGQYIRYVPKKREYRRKRTQEWKGDTDEIPGDPRHRREL